MQRNIASDLRNQQNVENADLSGELSAEMKDKMRKQKKKDYMKKYYQEHRDKPYYSPKNRYWVLTINNNKYLFDSKEDIIRLTEAIQKRDITDDMVKMQVCKG